MPLLHLFPSFASERILYEDDDLIVVDKPVDMSTHAPDAGRTDDVLSRLRLALAERDRQPIDRVYLGTHQRLDRDTSGVLLFTRRKSANAAVAAEFEQRHVEKTYLACVADWPKKLDRGVLTHLLAPGEAGRMQVVPPTPRGGAVRGRRVSKAQQAVTRFRVVRRVGTRALLELTPETGRTHQLRVQIAAAGGRLAGDRLYDGEAAVRLMLHAARLKLRHPTSGEPLEVRAPTPPELERWLAGPTPLAPAGDSLFEMRLGAAIDARWALGRSEDTTAFRLVHGEGDGIEGIAVDVYGEHLLVHFFSDDALARKDLILDALEALGAEGVYLKVHPKQSNTLVDPRVPSLAPATPLRGAPAPDPLIISENGLSFRVRLGDGLKTGIFLDQRENRRRVRELSQGKTVLNLFAYTCAFTVAAAAGGARATVSVDSSKGVLAWGTENLEQNGLSGSHLMIDEDAFVWLKRAAKRDERFDLVVLDPPSYATTKTSRFSAANDYADLAALALSVLAPGGRIIACTNHRGISLRKFRKQMHEAGRLAHRVIVQVKDLPCPPDFPAPMGGEANPKSLLVTVE